MHLKSSLIRLFPVTEMAGSSIPSCIRSRQCLHLRNSPDCLMMGADVHTIHFIEFIIGPLVNSRSYGCIVSASLYSLSNLFCELKQDDIQSQERVVFHAAHTLFSHQYLETWRASDVKASRLNAYTYFYASLDSVWGYTRTFAGSVPLLLRLDICIGLNYTMWHQNTGLYSI